MEEIIGYDFIKKTIDQFVDIVNDPGKYLSHGVRPPRGLLFVGAPGTGKTMFARYFMGKVSAPKFTYREMSKLEKAKELHSLFAEARKKTPSIVFIDEVDSLISDDADFLASLLGELDGYEAGADVFVLGCASSVSVLPSPLLRPGRFDRVIALPKPDAATRELMFEKGLAGIPHDRGMSFPYLALASDGFSSADVIYSIQNMAYEAAGAGHPEITMKDAERAFEAIGRLGGAPVSLDGESIASIAAHEAGHLVYALAHPEKFRPLKACVGLSENTRGYVLSADLRADQSEDRRGKIVDAASRLAGLAGQETLLGRRYDGATADILDARLLITEMVAREGMEGVAMAGVFDCSTFTMRKVSNESTEAVERRIGKLLDEAYDDAKRVLSENLGALKAASDLLAGKREIYESDFRALPIKEAKDGKTS